MVKDCMACIKQRFLYEKGQLKSLISAHGTMLASVNPRPNSKAHTVIHSPEISIGPPFNLNCSIIHIIIDLDFFTVYKVALQVTITNLIFRWPSIFSNTCFNSSWHAFH